MDKYRDDPFEQQRRLMASQRAGVTFGDEDPVSRGGWPAQTNEAAFERSQNAFMNRVYTWMFAGLALTAGTAWMVGHSPTLLAALMPHWVLLTIAQLGVVIALSFLLHKLSSGAATALFIGYAFLTGLSFSTLFLAFHVTTIARVFLLSAAMFGAMSLYGATTKKNLSAWRSFLFMGLFGMLAAILLNIFVESSALDFVVSCVGVIVFSGLTAYDTQKLRHMHAALFSTSGGEVAGLAAAGKLAIIGALALYLDFINLFLSLLRLFGGSRD